MDDTQPPFLVATDWQGDKRHSLFVQHSPFLVAPNQPQPQHCPAPDYAVQGQMQLSLEYLDSLPKAAEWKAQTTAEWFGLERPLTEEEEAAEQYFNETLRFDWEWKGPAYDLVWNPGNSLNDNDKT